MSTMRFKSQKRQAGFTMIELMIAGAVLVIGLLAVAALFSTAVGNNGRSRIDSTATMVSQAVIEQIMAVLARGGPSSITDCNGVVFPIATTPGGANLSGAGVDFTETAPPDGYWMKSGTTTGYTVCPSTSGGKTVYDVRWNIQQISAASQPTYLITVAARPKNMKQARFTFALPVTLRAYVGSQ